MEELQKNSLLGGMTSGGAVVGGLLGGIPGALAGAAVNAVFKPSQIARQIAILEHISAKPARVENTIRAGVKGLLKDGRAIAKAKPGQARTRNKTPVAAAAASLFGKTAQSRRKSYERQEKQLERFLNDTEYTLAHVSNVIGPIGVTAPRVAAEVVQQHQRAVEFLSSKMPPKLVPSNTFQPSLYQRKATDQEILRFSRYSTAVSKPLSVMDDLRSGHLTSESVEAIREVYPQIYAKMRDVVIDELSSAKHKPPFRHVQRLSLLLDIPGHPALNYDFVRRQQERQLKAHEEAGKPTASPPASGGGASKPAASAMTTSERITNT